ncbi:MAG: hypothetical protein ACRETU_00800, partial [Steroidobacterales bacterium]
FQQIFDYRATHRRLGICVNADTANLQNNSANKLAASATIVTFGKNQAPWGEPVEVARLNEHA